MEFENLVSSKKAIEDLKGKFVNSGFVKTAADPAEEFIIRNLGKACKYGRVVLKRLKTALDDPDLISEYVSSVVRFTAISDKIINKMEENLNAKKDS